MGRFFILSEPSLCRLTRIGGVQQGLLHNSHFFGGYLSTRSLDRRKPGVLRRGFVGMRGKWSHGYGVQDHECPLPPCALFSMTKDAVLQLLFSS